MRITYWAWFDSKSERTEFIKILNESPSKIEAIRRLSVKYPQYSLEKLNGVVENFNSELNKNV